MDPHVLINCAYEGTAVVFLILIMWGPEKLTLGGTELREGTAGKQMQGMEDGLEKAKLGVRRNRHALTERPGQARLGFRAFSHAATKVLCFLASLRSGCIGLGGWGVHVCVF